MTEEHEIIEVMKFIKKNSPKLHLYVAASMLSRVDRGTFRIRAIEARRTLGSIFHVNKQSQLTILRELEIYKLILKINRKEYLIPFTKEEYEELFQQPLKEIEND